MADIFLARLRALTAMNADEIAAIAALLSTPSVAPAERQLLAEGDTPQRMHILVDGMAARVKLMQDGRRHLCALLVPGDVCDIDGLQVRLYDYGVVTLARSTLVTIDRAALLALCDASPRVAHALSWLGYVDNALLNEAATSLARRSALQRIAHLLCELQLRVESAGQARADHLPLPLSQAQIADALGLTGVHVNRILREMRVADLLTIAGRKVMVPDWEKLRRVAEFSPGYLHLGGMRESVS